jgi:hypothetical protein
LNAFGETIGATGGAGLFTPSGGVNNGSNVSGYNYLTVGQIGGQNTVSGLLTLNGPSKDAAGGFYELQMGALSAGAINVDGGVFNQTGGQAMVSGAVNNLGGSVTIGAGGTFSVGGAYANVGVTLLEGGTLQASGGILAAGD